MKSKTAGRRWYHPSPDGRIDHELIWGLMALAMFAAAALPPAWLSRMPLFFCPFKQWTGLPCCLCGGTRAMQAFVRGHWLAAGLMNPMALAMGLGGTLYLAYAAVAILTGRRWRPRPAHPRRMAAWLTLAAAGGVFANWAYLILAHHPMP